MIAPDLIAAHAALTEAGARFVLVDRNRGGWTRAHVRWGRKVGGVTDAHRVFRSADADEVAMQFDRGACEREMRSGRLHLVGHLPACLGLAVIDVDAGNKAAQWEFMARLPEARYSCRSRSRGYHVYYDCDPARVDWSAPGTRHWTARTAAGNVSGDLLIHSRLAFFAGQGELTGLARALTRPPSTPWHDGRVAAAVGEAVAEVGEGPQRAAVGALGRGKRVRRDPVRWTTEDIALPRRITDDELYAGLAAGAR